MKTLILYKSKYGVTKKYAYWIHQKLPDSQIENIEIVNPNELENFDTIIIGSNTNIGQIATLDFIVDNWNVLQQ